MPNSNVTYAGDGATTQFAIPFAYIEEDDITVSLDGVDDPTFTFISSTIVEITPAPAGGVVIYIKRTTDTTRKVDHQDGTTITEATLDLDSNQTIYLAQEASDDVASKIGIDSADDKIDAQSKIIKSVTTGVASTDAANVGQVTTLTAADVALTNADVVTTNADVVLTNADVALTNADVVLTNADVVLTGLDVVATNADVVSTGLDVVATNADVVTTNADVVLAEAARDAVKSNTMHAFWFGAVPASTEIFATEMAEVTDLPASLTDSRWACKVAPSTAVTFSLQKNSVEVATVTFNASSTTADTYTNAGVDTFTPPCEFSIVTPSDTYGMEGLKATTVFV